MSITADEVVNLAAHAWSSNSPFPRPCQLQEEKRILIRAVMTEVMAEVDKKESLDKVVETKHAVGDNLALTAKAVTESVSKLLMSRIKDYGFPPSYKGILSFLDELNRPELREDESLAGGRLKLMALLMP